MAQQEKNQMKATEEYAAGSRPPADPESLENARVNAGMTDTGPSVVDATGAEYEEGGIGGSSDPDSPAGTAGVAPTNVSNPENPVDAATKSTDSSSTQGKTTSTKSSSKAGGR